MANTPHTRLFPASTRISCRCALALAFVLAPYVHAQAFGSGQDQAPGLQPDLRAELGAAESLPLGHGGFGFETRPEPEYVLAPGDELAITVAGRPELSGLSVLGPDGRLTLPISGVVALAGLTRQHAADAIVAQMRPFYTDPAVTVGVTRYAGNTVLLVGDVLHPGMQSFDHPATLLELLSRGGVGASSESGLPATSTIAMRTENRPALPQRALIYRGNSQVADVEVGKLLSGESFADIPLQRNDVVLIPKTDDLVSVLGAVKNPGAVRLNAQTTLAVLLAQAGGLEDKAGGNPLIRIVNQKTGNVQEVRFKQLLKGPVGKPVELHTGDVIFVPTSEFGKFAYVVDKLSPIATVTTVALAYTR